MSEIKFDSDRAQKYDRKIRISIPGYEGLHNMAYALLGLNLGRQADILVVGSGTGMEIVNLSQLYPEWQFTGVEPSPDMMAVANQKLAENKLGDRVKLHLGVTDELPESKLYDAATLMLVMHFLPDDGSKLALLQSIAKRLKPGATFIIADLHGDKKSRQFQHFSSAWKLYEFNSGVASKQEIEENFNLRMNAVHYVVESRIIELLQTVGFNEIERFYNAYLFGGWVAKFHGNC
ncbi:MAG: class I SAM-dependent methyltransferase [Cyanosarcina radialis HA8281-LM2]|jgi:tRNA (cmo5U34)-methyltransferase|nr:class I SAM-dependent methyltransferase [Cyanosarcina radialis HA8281-LM2]